MEMYHFDNLGFSYPEQEGETLQDITLTVSKGDFLVLCGPSGSGKSTLLRHLKTCLSPAGIKKGSVLYCGQPLDEVETAIQIKEIGYVLQSPENQVVTDKVWHELAFGLESLGYSTPVIRRRVAEIAAFFGIENWYYKDVRELSGGQKQLLSLASIMAMQPEVLILDEPTAQLDPIAAADFLALIGKINRELGTTIILTEHRLEETFPFATRVVVMDEGKIFCDSTPSEVGHLLRRADSNMFLAMPTAIRIWSAIETNLSCPISVRDGAEFLSAFAKENEIKELPCEQKKTYPEEPAISCEGLWFRYEKELPDVVRGLNLSVRKGEFYALLGGNGAGKSTTLKIISGLKKAYRGDINICGKVALLPQNPQTLFVRKTVRDDLYEIYSGQKVPKDVQDSEVASVAVSCEITELLDRHPYDLSGGEQQRVALAKVLLTKPEILLLDEPTKGCDAEFKLKLANVLKSLCKSGMTILMVSHDIVFCSEHADRCGMFFDGMIAAEGLPREFFSGNSFYTTPTNRMARAVIREAVTPQDVIYCCGGDVEESATTEFTEESEVVASGEEKVNSFTPDKLPLWRKIVAGISGIVALAVFIYSISTSDLSQFINENGITSLAKDNIPIYIVLIVSLFIFLGCITRKTKNANDIQTKVGERKLSKRTTIAAILILLFIPATIFAGVVYLGDRYYNLVAIAVLFECMIPFALVFEGRKPQPRELVTISVLCAIGVAGRSAFFMLPNFKPVLALTIISGVAFGGETGFLVGAVTMLASNVLFSQGPWTPWQMFTMGIIGFLAGVLFRKGWLRRSKVSLAVFGAISAIVIYGGIMNFASAVMWSPSSLSFKVILAYYVTGFPVDLVHASATVIFIMLAAEPMLEKLERIKKKYGMIS